MTDYSLEDEDYRRREFNYQAQEWNKKVKKMYVHNKLVNGVTLSYETVFGINYQKIYRNLLNIGEDFIIFSVGTSVAIKDLTTKATKFYTKEHRLRYVTCLNAAYDKDENILVAVGESTLSNEDKAAYVTIINTKENKWITLNTNMRAHIKEIIIEPEKKYVAALVYQFQAANPQILFWDYGKEKLIGQAVIRIPVEKISFYLTKPKQILIQTPTYIRVWELNTQEKSIRETHIQFLNLKKESGARILDHCWFPHRNTPILLILQNNNIVHVVQNDIVKKDHNIDTTQMSLSGVAKAQEAAADDLDEYLIGIDDKLDDDSPVADASPRTAQSNVNMAAITQGLEFNCIAPTKKGFILGGTKGIIGFFEIEKSLAITNGLSYQCPNPDDCKVVFLATNQKDSITSVVTTNLSDGKFNYYLLNVLEIDSGTSPIQPFFPTGFHNMSITSMSVCRSRAILATSSDDGYVRIWNYFEAEDEKKGIISHYFKDMPLSVSLHPCSQFLAVAFGNCYKIFAILSDSLHPLTTVNLTLCKLVKYTHGGHYLIVNERSNIILFDTIYYDALFVFDAHTSLIKDLVITEDDTKLISTCEGGFVYVWDLVKPEKNFHKEWQHKNTMYNKILYDHENDLMYGCTGEKPICIYSQMCKEKVAEFITGNSDHDTRAAILSLKHQVLFTGTNKGTIKVFLWPMTKENFEIESKPGSSLGTFSYKFPECIEYNAHLSPVTYLEISHDGNYLFSGAADGSVFIFKITDVNFDYSESKKPGEKEEKKFGALANEIYLEKLSKIKEQNEHIKKLHFEVTKSQQTVKIELKKLEMMFKTKIDQINADFNNDIQANSQKKENFMDKALREYDITFMDYERLKDVCGQDVLKTLEMNKAKEEYESFRNKEVENEIQRIKEKHQVTLSKMSSKHRTELEAIRSKYQQKCEQVQSKYNSVVDQAKAHGVYFLQKLERNEADCEKENEEKTKELIDAIGQEKQINNQLQGSHAKLSNKNDGERKQDTEKQNKLDEVIAKNNKLKEENISYMAALLKMQEQLLEREEVILSKEETCKAARDEQINLENFRYLLDQKIKTLSNEKEGMLEKIASQEHLLKDTFQELIRESGKNDDKHELIKSKETKIRVMDTEIKKVDHEIIHQRQRFNDMINNIDKVLGTKEKEKWGTMLRDMMTRARQSGDDKVILRRDLSDKEILEILKQSEEKAYDVNDELLKQAKWITKKLYLVNVTGRNLRDIKEASIQNILAQNGKLIEECNLLRGDNENLTNKMKFLEKVVQDGIKKKRKIENNTTTMSFGKQNKSQIKLEKISKDGLEDEGSTHHKSLLSKYPIAGSLPTDNSASKRQVQAFEERNKNVLSLKTSPDGLSKRLLPEISPQKSVRGPAPKTQAFVVEEAANEGERAASK